MPKIFNVAKTPDGGYLVADVTDVQDGVASFALPSVARSEQELQVALRGFHHVNISNAMEQLNRVGVAMITDIPRLGAEETMRRALEDAQERGLAKRAGRQPRTCSGNMIFTCDFCNGRNPMRCRCRCKICNAQGQRGLRGNTTAQNCRSCSGTGNDPSCSICHGTGNDNRTCIKCGGAAKVDLEIAIAALDILENRFSWDFYDEERRVRLKKSLAAISHSELISALRLLTLNRPRITEIQISTSKNDVIYLTDEKGQFCGIMRVAEDGYTLSGASIHDERGDLGNLFKKEVGLPPDSRGQS